MLTNQICVPPDQSDAILRYTMRTKSIPVPKSLTSVTRLTPFYPLKLKWTGDSN